MSEMLAANFYCFGALQELHSDEGHDFLSHLIYKVLQYLGVSKMNTTLLHQQLGGTGERYTESQGALMKSCHFTPEGLGHKITELPPCLMHIHSRHYMFDPG
jgi:hypothetical protein